MTTCENCSSLTSGEYGSGRFCSAKCARGFSTKNKRNEINEKVSRTLKGSGNRDVTKKCNNCNSNFVVSWRKRKQLYCSVSCAKKVDWTKEEFKQNMSEMSKNNALMRHANGDTSLGWQSRKKMKMSYPEILSAEVLNELGINYEREYKVDRYFIDFALLDFNIALEIDGQQHLLPDRILSDKRKDKKLGLNNWVVIRVKYGPGHKDNLRKILNDILQLPC